jgi:hypothetical protein
MWLLCKYSSLIGKPTSQEPTMFCTLKSVNLTSKPQFLMIFAYFFAACFERSQFFAPVQTILPIYRNCTWGEDECCGFGVPETHDDCCEPFGVVLCVSALEGDLLQLQSALQVQGRHHVPGISYGYCTWGFMEGSIGERLFTPTHLLSLLAN